MKPILVPDQLARLMAWVSDGSDLEEVRVPLCGKILVQVEGDLDGKDVLIFGGLSSATALLECVKHSPALVVIPPVRIVKPVAPAGVTITIMGAA